MLNLKSSQNLICLGNSEKCLTETLKKLDSTFVAFEGNKNTSNKTSYVLKYESADVAGTVLSAVLYSIFITAFCKFFC